MKPKFRSLAAAFAPLTRSSLIFCASLCAAHADQTWSGSSDTFWNNASNWTSAVPGASDVAIFDANSISNLATSLGADTSVAGIKIVDPAGAISVAAGNALTIGASGVNMSAATQNLTLAGATLNGVGVWDIAAGRQVQFEGSIIGTGGITKNGAGTLYVHWFEHSFSGGLTVNAGEVRTDWGGPTNSGSATTASLGSGLISLNGGSIRFQSTKAPTVNSALSIGSPGGALSARTTTYFNPPSIAGSGTLTLSMDNGTTISADNFRDFSGTISVAPLGANGYLRLGNNYVLASGQNAAWTLGPGAHVTRQNGTSFVTTIVLGSLTGDVTSDIGGSAAGGGTFVYQIGNRGEDCTYDGGIVDGGTKTGVEVVNGITLTLTHTSALTYTGDTTVGENSFLKMTGIKSGTGATNVTAFGTLTGTGSLAGTTTVQTDGTLAPGDEGIGNITHTNLTLNSGSILSLEFGSGNDTVTIASGGTLTIANGATVDVNGFDTLGTYTIINTTGATVSGSASTALSAVGGNGSLVYTFADTGTAIEMTISASDPSNYWNVDGGDTWDLGTNWTKSVIPNASEAIAKVGPGVGGSGGFFTPTDFTITLDADQTVGTLVAETDNVSTLTIDPGTTTPGSLTFDNGAGPSILSAVAGDLIINPAIVVDADGLTVDVAQDTTVDPAEPYLLTINGEVSGSGAALAKSGLGTLALAGDNTYDGGTTLNAGSVSINSATSLGAVGAPAVFAGGAIQLDGDLSTISRSYQVSGTQSAIIDTNGFAFGYDGVISPFSGGTGGLTKNGDGTMTLSAAQTYTGETRVNTGVLDLATGSTINGSSANVIASGAATLSVSGGTLTASAASYMNNTNGGPHLLVSGGNANFNGGLNANNNKFNGYSIELTGGTFSASSVTLGRGGLNNTPEPAGGSTTEGFYMNGTAVAQITGGFSVGYNSNNVNSSVSARIDAGSLTVGGTTQIGMSGGRWSILDINGGTFTSTDAVNGVLVGLNVGGNAKFLVRAGTATAERISLQQITASTYTSLLDLSGGSLYVGSGGIVGNINGGTGVLEVRLGTATLGAKANWSSDLAMTLNTATTLKAADASDAAFDIELSGALGGTGNLVKTGDGMLTLSGTNVFTGTTTVSAGTLAITGDSSGATGTITVASGATLGGNGNIGGDVTIESGGTHSLAVADMPANQVTRVITGTLDMTTTTTLDLSAAVAPEAGTYVLATATSIIGDLPTVTGVSGSLAITNSGTQLEFTADGGSAYDSWASGYSLTEGASGDDDKDGISNGVEFVLGTNPTTEGDQSKLPTLSRSGGNMVFVFRRTSESAYLNPAVQHDADLVAPWTTAADGVDGVTILEETDGFETGVDKVTVTIPTASAKHFARLNVVVP